MSFQVLFIGSFISVAVAESSPLDETLLTAQTALLAGDYESVFTLLEGAEKGFERSVSIVDPKDMANVYLYRGVAAQLNQSDGIPHFRSALTIYMGLEWDTDLSDDDLSQDIFAQVKREVSSRSRISPDIPEQLGLARIYINGVQRNHGEKVISGYHLAQIKCPKGDVYGRWTDFSKPIKWLKMCPYRVDVTATPPVVENEWASLVPNGIPSIPGIPAIPGGPGSLTGPAEEEEIVVLTAWEKINKPYLASAGGLAIISGLSYAMSSQAHSQYYDVENTEINNIDELNSLKSKTNRLMATSVGFGAGAAVLYTAALWRVRR